MTRMPLAAEAMAELRSLLQMQDLKAASRLAVAATFPDSWPQDEIPELLRASLPLARLLLSEVSDDGQRRDLAVLLPWLSRTPVTEASRELVVECAQITLQWLQSPGGRGSPGAQNAPGFAPQALIVPLLNLLAGLDEVILRKELLLAAATATQLPQEILRDELRHDPEHMVEKLVPAYFTNGQTNMRMPSYPAHTGLTQADVDALSVLESASRENAAARMALWVLSAFPDSADSPPTPSRSARVAGLLADARADHSDWDLVEMLIDIWGLSELFLPELLPVLRQHPAVIDLRKTAALPLAEGTPRAARKPRILCLWAVAEHLHGGDPQPWKNLASLIQKDVEAVKAAAERQAKNAPAGQMWISPYGPRSGAPPMRSVWIYPSERVLREVCLQWVKSSLAEEWSRLVPLVMNARALLSDTVLIPLLQEVLIVVGKEGQEASWHPVAEFLATLSIPDARNLPHEGVPWSEVSQISLSPEIRRQIALLRLSGKPFMHPARSGQMRINYMFFQLDELPGPVVKTRLMEPAALAEFLPDLPLDIIWLRPDQMVSWLAAAGYPDEALHLIRKLAQETGTEVNRRFEHWLMLAVQAADLGDEELVNLLLEKAGTAPAETENDEMEGVRQRFNK